MSGTASRYAVILTGDRGSGKTTLCRDLAAGSGDVSGIICPDFLDGEGRRTGKNAFCLSTGKSWPIARTDADLGGPRLGRFSFSAEGLRRAADCLCAGLRRAPRVCILDEIGPLELELGTGFAPAFPLLERAARLLLVVRPGLVRRAAALIPHHECRTVLLEPGSRVVALRAVQEILFD